MTSLVAEIDAPARILEVDGGATETRATNAAAELARLPVSHRASALDVDDDASAINLLAIRVLVRGLHGALVLELDERVPAALAFLVFDQADLVDLAIPLKLAAQLLLRRFVANAPNKQSLVRVVGLELDLVRLWVPYAYVTSDACALDWRAYIGPCALRARRRARRLFPCAGVLGARAASPARGGRAARSFQTTQSHGHELRTRPSQVKHGRTWSASPFRPVYGGILRLTVGAMYSSGGLGSKSILRWYGRCVMAGPMPLPDIWPLGVALRTPRMGAAPEPSILVRRLVDLQTSQPLELCKPVTIHIVSISILGG